MPFCLVEWNHLCHFVRSRGPNKEHLGVITVNSEMRSFVKIKSSQNGEITLSFTDIDKTRIFANFQRRNYVFKRYSRKYNSHENFRIYSIQIWARSLVGDID